MVDNIPPEIWAEMLKKHNDDGLNAAQISRLLAKRYKIYRSRQAIWSRLDRYRFFTGK